MRLGKYLFSLKLRNDFKIILENGYRMQTQYFKLYYLYPNTKLAKAGIKISRKVGNAVKRNKIKRQIRHILRELRIINLNIIIRVKQIASKCKFLELKQDLSCALLAIIL